MASTKVVQWWEQWQLRFLVLASLFLQFFLFISSSLRKRTIPPWFRFFIWLAYLGSDAVAIFALATLFSYHKKQEWTSTHRGSADVEVLWAPILLVHLGGQDGITAYNIEDNELWRRHVLTAISQVAVAIYVFSKSWSGDRNILLSTIMLFLCGILKCLLKPWDLKRVSINSLVDDSGYSEENTSISSLHEYIRAAIHCVQADHEDKPSDNGEGSEETVQNTEISDEFHSIFTRLEQNSRVLNMAEFIWRPYNLCVDLAPSYGNRISCLKYFLHNEVKAQYIIQYGLANMFDRLFTKEVVLGNKLANLFNCELVSIVRSLTGVLTLTAIIIFHKIHRESYNDIDVKITYSLLYLTALLEYIIPIVVSLNEISRQLSLRPWPDQVAQYNLIGYLYRNKNHRKLRKLATVLVCKDYLDQLWCMKPSNSSREITELVHSYIKTGWQQISDITTYRRFNDNRGQWTLGRNGILKKLSWSLRMPFDDSVLVWHLATDFYFHHMDTPPGHKMAHRCREMSNYMVYLLFVNPEMLMAGARRKLFKTAYKELKKIKLYERHVQGEKELMQNIIHRIMGTEGSGMVRKAWAIAQVLITLHGEGDDKIWRVIQGVWVEMLCFSAGRCRGYLHAKSLGKGGEYLSYVWLLQLYMGMETLAEKMQRTELHEETDESSSVVSPRSAMPV
ncbi:unnamed protein product [Urochloa humidicola]